LLRCESQRGKKKKGNRADQGGPAARTHRTGTLGLLPPRCGIHRGGTGKRAATGNGGEEARLDDGVAEKMAELLLLRLVPEAARGEVGNAGNGRMPWRLSAGETAPASSKLGGREEWCESEGARRGPFIGRRGRARGWPEVGAGAVSIEAAVAGRVGGAWAASAGVGVMSVARWSRRVTTNETGSSGICGSSEGNSGRCRLAVSRPAGLRGQRGMVEGRGDAMRLARARAGREGDSGRCRSAVATSGSDAHQVFDKMPARSKNSNF
jgi:hypothetical protein